MRRDVGACSPRQSGDSWFTTDISIATGDSGGAGVGRRGLGPCETDEKESAKVTDNKKGWSACADQPFKMLGGA
jgi:hypothetical protein